MHEPSHFNAHSDPLFSRVSTVQEATNQISFTGYRLYQKSGGWQGREVKKMVVLYMKENYMWLNFRKPIQIAHQKFRDKRFEDLKPLQLAKVSKHEYEIYTKDASIYHLSDNLKYFWLLLKFPAK